MDSLKKIMIIISIFVSAMVFCYTNAHADSIVSVEYVETWDVINTVWDYEYSVTNLSTGDENLYDFYLDVDPTEIAGINLTNITDPDNWENFTDNSTYISWSSLYPSADIAPEDMLTFIFSSDTQLGDLPFEMILDAGTGPGTLYGGSHSPIPEPGTIFLLGAGFFGLVGFKKKFFIKQWIESGKEVSS